VPQPPGFHKALNPDLYQGPFKASDPNAVDKYVEDVASIIKYCTAGKIAGFHAEPIQGVGGVVEMPEGYLKRVYELVHAAGGLCVSDEVQTGFGRTGTNFWGFQNHGVMPDIVTMAKGIGSGIPLAAVACRPEIAKAFSRIHFNTFGGNPLVSAMGSAVLKVMDRDHTQHNCLEMGNYLLTKFKALQEKHQLIGEVRGKGLMLGVELVKDRITRAPATAETLQVFEIMKDMGVLIGKGGLYGNVLRIKPPMCITKADADFIADVLDHAIKQL
jgi:alanine-glyoxylate transaminase/(R)-3-amino-2-methylpropionate-pyruvate transaminase